MKKTELTALSLFLKRLKEILGENEYETLIKKKNELKITIFEALAELNLLDYGQQKQIIKEIAEELNIPVKMEKIEINPQDVKIIQEDYILIGENEYVSYFIKDIYGTLSLVSFAEFREIKRNLGNKKSEEIFTFKEIVEDALSKGVSDIHIKPSKDLYYVYFRQKKQFVLQRHLIMNTEQGRTLIQNLKNYAHNFTKGNFQADIKSKVQDARAEYPDLSATVRLAFMPMPNLEDEYVVARVLKTQAISGGNLQELGYLDEDIDLFMDVLNRRGGIVVVSGMTNSGKSTFVAKLLSTIKDKNIITVENPVEYIIGNPNVSQHQVFETEMDEVKATFIDFAKGIKRADGDIVFLGEWRNDKELSEIMEELSLAGQLIFTTLHINSAFNYFDSVESMYGVSKRVLIETLILSLNQTLIKKPCKNCSLKLNGKDAINKLIDDKVFTKFTLKALPFVNTDEFINELEKIDIYVLNHDGCDACNHLGFTGLTPVYEYFYPSLAFKEWIIKEKPTPAQIEMKARKDRIGKNKLDVYLQKLKDGEVSLNDLASLR